MDSSKIKTIRGLIESAQSNLESANNMLAEISGDEQTVSSSEPAPANTPAPVIEPGDLEEAKIVEGVFDGQSMIDAEGKKYPVPANYASKSKLVVGDILKLTIQDDGRFLYKQIGPVERKTVIGILKEEGGHFHVLANDKQHNVLLASVTYFKAQAGNEVTIIIPAKEESDWACIDNVLAS